MKSPLAFILSLLLTLSYGQSSLNVFQGSLDEALKKAQQDDKNIFLITKSLRCNNFLNFRDTLDNDTDAYNFINNEFIVFIYDYDNADKAEKKRFKKYYHSWRGFPQLYFIDKNEKIIAELLYNPSIAFNDQLKIWKDYKNIKKSWKAIKKQKRNSDIDYDFVIKYMTYRLLISSSFDVVQINNLIAKYFNNIDTSEYYLTRNWVLIKDNILYRDIFSNQRLFDFVQKHRDEFIKENGEEEISAYLLDNYMNYLSRKKKKKLEKLSNKYPFTTVPEAKKALKFEKLRRSTFYSGE